MRKLKKINGYLVVKFNDRERRSWEELGQYGVIDAELYTGDIDLDRDAMEYCDAETLEQAVEQARGLDAEMDVSGDPPTYTIVAETDEAFGEEEFNPKLLIQGMERRIADMVQSEKHDEMDAGSAACMLRGYKEAFRDLGVISGTDALVEPDHFAGLAPSPLPRHPEELLTYICDEVCREVVAEGRTKEELDEVCGRCKVELLAQEADARELRLTYALRDKAAKHAERIKVANLPILADRALREAHGFLVALEAANVLPASDIRTYEKLIQDAADSRPYRQPRDSFRNLEPRYRELKAAKGIYAVGLFLENKAEPTKDDALFLEIFREAVQLDEALDDYPEEDPTRVREVLLNELTHDFHLLHNLYIDFLAHGVVPEELIPR